MTKKKKTKQQRTRRLKQKRTRRAQRRAQARLKRRLRQGPLDDYKVVVSPKGQVKMSEVLEAFVEPYVDEVDDTIEARTKLFSLAALAWNATFLPEEEQQETIEQLLKDGLQGVSEETKRDLGEIVAGMIERKLTHFAEYQRAITGNNRQLALIRPKRGP